MIGLPDVMAHSPLDMSALVIEYALNTIREASGGEVGVANDRFLQIVSSPLSNVHSFWVFTSRDPR